MEKKSGGLGTYLLIGGSIFLTAALVFILLAPVSRCNDCKARRIRVAYDEQLWYDSHKTPYPQPPPPPCERCRDRYQITLFNKWFGRPSRAY